MSSAGEERTQNSCYWARIQFWQSKFFVFIMSSRIEKSRRQCSRCWFLNDCQLFDSRSQSKSKSKFCTVLSQWNHIFTSLKFYKTDPGLDLGREGPLGQSWLWWPIIIKKYFLNVTQTTLHSYWSAGFKEEPRRELLPVIVTLNKKFNNINVMSFIKGTMFQKYAFITKHNYLWALTTASVRSF